MYFHVLKITCGEYTFNDYFISEGLTLEENKEYISSYYSDSNAYKENDKWYFNNGEVAVGHLGGQPITNAEIRILKDLGIIV